MGDLLVVELDSAEVEDVARDKRRHTTVFICRIGGSLNRAYLNRCDRKRYQRMSLLQRWKTHLRTSTKHDA